MLFNSKANCFACHTGWRFTDDKFHDIGTTKTDLGRGRERQERRADAVCVQDADAALGRAAAALHAQRLVGDALNEVVKHYEKEPIDRPSRSPLFMPVPLTEQERLDLVAFMQTLNGQPEGEAAPTLPAVK